MTKPPASQIERTFAIGASTTVVRKLKRPKSEACNVHEEEGEGQVPGDIAQEA
jgi:hypothetical protein